MHILTLNCNGMIYGQCLPHESQRALNIARLLSGEVIPADPSIRDLFKLLDVVCLQECFKNSFRDIIRNECQYRFPYSQADDTYGACGGLGANSGLMILSRWPITRHILHTFTNYRGIEDFCKKGVLAVEVLVDLTVTDGDTVSSTTLTTTTTDTPTSTSTTTTVPPTSTTTTLTDDITMDVGKHTKRVAVYSTHLGTGSDVPFPLSYLTWWWDSDKLSVEDTKMLQVQEVRDVVETFQQPGCDLNIVCGDFNLPANLYQSHLNAMMSPLVDTFDAAASPAQNSDRTDVHKRIDYAWISGTVATSDTVTPPPQTDLAQRYLSVIVETFGDNTDHNAVLMVPRLLPDGSEMSTTTNFSVGE